MFGRSIQSEISENSSSYGSPKEAQQKMLRNSNIYKQESNSQSHFCLKHQNKKAKYYADNDKSKLFCSKCALSLALKGMKIEETPSDEELMRKTRIQQFTKSVTQLIKQLECKTVNLRNDQIEQNNAFEEQKTVYIRMFDLMTYKTNQMREQVVSSHQRIYENQNEELQQLIDYLYKSEKQLQQFQSDISMNEDNIVKRMEMKPFEDIMGRYQSKVFGHQKMIDGVNFNWKVNQTIVSNDKAIEQSIEMICQKFILQQETKDSLSKGHMFQQITDQCISKLQNHVADMRFNDDGEEVYQSTCSGSMLNSQHKQSKPISQSPMRQLPPFPKTQTQYISNRESITESPQGKIISENQKTTIKSHFSSQSERILSPPRQQEFYSNETKGLDSLQLQLKLGMHQYRDEQKQKTPKLQNSLNNSITKNSSAKKKELPLQVWSQNYQEQQSVPAPQKSKFLETNIYNTQSQGGLIVQNQRSKIQSTKRSISKGLPPNNEVSKSEGKRQFILEQPTESLKDRIFNEISGCAGESVYNQVLKINQKKTTRYIKEKENFYSTDWGSTQPIKKNTYLTTLNKQR